MPGDPLRVLLVLAAGVIGYLAGSFSSGFIVGKVYRNVDLRDVGSRSTGAANALRTLGPGAAALVSVVDVAKGALAVYLAQLMTPLLGTELAVAAQALAGLGAVAGHCWPITLQWRGGRGVATGAGALLLVASPTLIFAVVLWGLAVAVTRTSSVASLSAVAGAFLGYLALSGLGLIPFRWEVLVFILVGGLIVYVRHIGNIRRIIAGREPRIGEPLRP